MPEVRVEGLKKLSRELKALGAGLQKELRKVSKDSAELVAEHERDIAPRLTGRLARTIKASATNNGGQVRTGGGLPYTKPIVFGWAGHNIAPNPFPYDALDDRRDEVIERFDRGVADLIKRTVHEGSND